MAKKQNNQHLIVKEVAALVQRDPSRIRQILIANPHLGEKRGRDWLISPANLQGIQRLLQSGKK